MPLCLWQNSTTSCLDLTPSASPGFPSDVLLSVLCSHMSSFLSEHMWAHVNCHWPLIILRSLGAEYKEPLCGRMCLCVFLKVNMGLYYCIQFKCGPHLTSHPPTLSTTLGTLKNLVFEATDSARKVWNCVHTFLPRAQHGAGRHRKAEE